MLLHFSFFWTLLNLFNQASAPAMAPPGTVAYRQHLFIDSEVVPIGEWWGFLYTIKRDSSAAFYQSMIPDTSKMVNGKNYFNHPAFSRKPLTGITYRQAQAFCKWRSNVVSENIAHPEKVCKSGQKYYSKQNKAYKITFRLPEPEELKTVAGKPKKVKTSPSFLELTNNEAILISKPFQQDAASIPANGKAAIGQTFRCIAYYEKR